MRKYPKLHGHIIMSLLLVGDDDDDGAKIDLHNIEQLWTVRVYGT